MGHATTTSIAGKSSFDSLHGHPTRPNIAALQRNTIASLQRSASMPSVPRIALTNSNANTQMVEGYLHSTSAGLPASPTTMTGPSSTYQHPSTQSLTVITSSIVHNNGNNGNNGMMHVMNNNSAWQSASPTTMTPTSMNGVINNPFMTVPSTSTTLNGMNQRLPMSSAPVSPVHDYGYHHTGHVMNNNHNSIYNYPSTMSQASTSSSPSLLVQSPSVVYSPRAATLPYPTANTTTMMVNNTATTTTTSTPTNNNLTNNNPFLFSK
ncbi:hypothetical protein BDF22DRAFT_214739 [Syncephalis plumigaleata]|nr:hypothetical protein BDF22DRAFT_214739 [Syncephalis plumigaleata]